MILIFWGLYFPLFKLLGFFVSWLPEYQERLRFERRNLTEQGAESFRELGLSADHCFEFSSEGELQQIASLIDDALGSGKRLELVFFSPSVERQVLELAAKHPTQIRYLRYPFLTFSPSTDRRCFLRWTTAPSLVLVRYDLFPEFLLWSRRPGHRLKLVWFTFKKERSRNRTVSGYKRLFLRHASTVIFATPADREQGHGLGHEGRVYDFRIEQINRRLRHREAKFSTYLPAYPQLRDLIHRFPAEKRLILGNVWPEDLHLLEKVPEDVFLLLLPHQLDSKTIEEISERLEALGRRVEEIAATPGHRAPSGNTVLMTSRGVLCELYQDFERAYVGGGFGKSVHSILEPFVAGCRLIAAGPVHHRSTEYDLAATAGVMTEVRDSETFRHWLLSTPAKSSPEGEVTRFLAEYENFKEEVLSC